MIDLKKPKIWLKLTYLETGKKTKVKTETFPQWLKNVKMDFGNNTIEALCDVVMTDENGRMKTGKRVITFPFSSNDLIFMGFENES